MPRIVWMESIPVIDVTNKPNIKRAKHAMINLSLCNTNQCKSGTKIEILGTDTFDSRQLSLALAALMLTRSKLFRKIAYPAKDSDVPNKHARNQPENNFSFPRSVADETIFGGLKISNFS